MQIPVYTPDLTGNEVAYVEDAVRSGWISSIGQYVERFEQALAAETGMAEAIAVCNGTVALHLALHCLDIGPGDEVIVIEPAYDCYVPAIELAGGLPVYVQLELPSGKVDWEQVRKAIRPRTRMIIVNTPHNPTGTVLDAEESQALAEVAVSHDLTVITDEVYEHLTFDGRRHIPLATLPGMWERTITLSSVGKSYSFTGWKVGWASGPPDLVAAVFGAKQWLSYTSGGPLQAAVALALNEETVFPTELATSLQERRDLLVAGLNDVGLPTRTPEGTYFAMSDVSSLGWPDGRSFCLALPERAGVVAIAQTRRARRPPPAVAARA